MRLWLPLLLLLSTTVGGCSAVPSDADGASTPEQPPVRIGVWEGVEPQLLGQIQAGLLAAADIDAVIESFSDADTARQALALEEIDVVIGYSGATWLVELGLPDPPGDPRSSFARVRDADRSDGIVWISPVFSADLSSPFTPPANATFAFFVRGVPAPEASIGTLSRLASRLASDPGAEVCVEGDFARRPDGLATLWERYGVSRDREVVEATATEAIRAVEAGECLAGFASATDGRAWSRGLMPLIDDLGVFPAFVIAPRVRIEIEESWPDIRPALAPLPVNMTTAMLGRWNARALSGTPIETVAADAVAELLRRAGRPVPEGATPPPVGA